MELPKGGNKCLQNRHFPHQSIVKNNDFSLGKDIFNYETGKNIRKRGEITTDALQRFCPRSKDDDLDTMMKGDLSRQSNSGGKTG